MKLSAPMLHATNAVLQTAAATVTILDDDGTPGVPHHFDWSSIPSLNPAAGLFQSPSRPAIRLETPLEFYRLGSDFRFA